MAPSTVGRSTRGNGILENVLADWRCRIAERLLGASATGADTSLLDIGCGGFPRLLYRSRAAVRVGLDFRPRHAWHDIVRDSAISLIVHDLSLRKHLPFNSGTFSAVSLLAVIEHLDAAEVAFTLREVHRVLHDGGRAAITTPSAAGHWVLGPMSSVGLVSREEIEEHRRGYTPAVLRRLLAEAGFQPDAVSSGYFQLGMNCWAVAEKGGAHRPQI
jgi:SAM-dependent methyltransferase